MKKAFQTFLIVMGCLLLLNSLILVFFTNFNFGTIFTFSMGVFLFICGIYYDKLLIAARTGFLKWVKYFVITGFILVVSLISFLAIYGNTDTVTYKEDALIILGAAIRGETVTLPLQYRLEKAILYLKENEKAIVVVSGGKGFQEDISEALAMERYLVSAGISKERILKEEKATSTYENFVYSKEILDKKFKSSYKIALVTNDFHVFRASRLAKIAGLSATHYHAKLNWYTVPLNYLRECAAIVKLLFLKK